MPKKAKELAAVEVNRLTKPGLHAVGGVAGLLLQVTKTGARSWILRVKVGARRRDMGLGGYPDVTLAQAREKARRYREEISEGKDPIAERKAAKEALRAADAARLTFDEAAERFLANKQHEFSNPKHRAQWGSTLKAYASPVIGKLQVADIETRHIEAVLSPIWLEKTETAKRVRGRVEKVLAWATTAGYRQGENPARWKNHLDTIFPTPGKVTSSKNHAALPWQEVGFFMEKLRQREGMAAKALEFAILCGSRSGEVRGATWQEIDLKGRMWTIPATRMKASKEHRVPLSPAAVALLQSLPRLEGEEHVFPAPRGGALSDMTLSALMKRMNETEVKEGRKGFVDPRLNKVATPHGFRSTFRDWAEENTSYPHTVTEMALAHAIGSKVEAAYRRGDLLAKRKRLMEDWAKYCGTVQVKGEVIGIREVKA